MVFSSAIFLFAFFPAVFVCYRLIPGQRCKNQVLILFSLVFYAFGSLVYTPLLLGSVLCNYLGGLLVARPGRFRKCFLAGTVAVNLLLLCIFKYLDFAIGNVNSLFGLSIPMAGITLPIGISFFTFQGMSYVIDVYRNPTTGSKSLHRVLLYIALFPQLVAGPIVKYLDVAEQIDHRTCTPELTSAGIRRFVIGLSKKLLLANTLGLVADQVFALSATALDLRTAWLGALCYTLQIYYDFSGYSDMAIGLGKIFGFTFYENFRHPYCAASMKDFWRRWHISLSSWFRDYLYIPLGGNRKGVLRARINRILVFFCTGLWHGASWTFVLWGLWHGGFLLLEDATGLHRRKGLRALGHIYTLLIVVFGFVLFRAESLPQAGQMMLAMVSGLSFTAESTAAFCNLCAPSVVVCLVFSAVCAVPVVPWLEERLRTRNSGLLQTVGLVGILLLYVVDILNLASTSFNPFIYFQF